MSNHTDVAPAPGNDPGPGGDQIVAPPDALLGLDRGLTPESPAVVDLTAVRHDGELPVAGSQPNPAQPAQPIEPANAADPSQRVNPPATDHDQQQPPQRDNPSPPEVAPSPKPKTNPKPPKSSPPPTPPAGKPDQRDQFAQKLGQLAQDWKAKSDNGKPAPPSGKDPGSKSVGKKDQMQPGSGKQKAKGSPGSRTASNRTSPSGQGSSSSGQSGAN